MSLLISLELFRCRAFDVGCTERVVKNNSVCLVFLSLAKLSLTDVCNSGNQVGCPSLRVPPNELLVILGTFRPPSYRGDSSTGLEA